MKKSWLVALALALVLAPTMAPAAGPGAARKQIESSMLVTGEVVINADGQVIDTVIDKPDELPPGVVTFVQEAIERWKFEPVMVDGKAVGARSRMTVRLIAKRQDKDSFTIAIRHADFPGPEAKEGEEVSSERLTLPEFPRVAVQHGAQGVVYLLLKIGRAGEVEDAVVEQVNLRIFGTSRQMSRLRDLFSESALRTARAWKFKPPVKGEFVDEAHWTVRVPVDYTTSVGSSDRYGTWQTYVPGPRQSAPWNKKTEMAGFSPDLLPDGGIYMAGARQGLRLLTPLGDG